LQLADECRLKALQPSNTQPWRKQRRTVQLGHPPAPASPRRGRRPGLSVRRQRPPGLPHSATGIASVL